MLLAALSHVGQNAQIQPGAPPGHSSVPLGSSWSFLDCSWPPLAMKAGMPTSSQELLLAIPACSWGTPGVSWASNTLRPVCQHVAKLLPTCAELAQEWKGGLGGKPRVSQKP